MRKLIYSIRNALWYRRPRGISQKTSDRLIALNDPKLALTELLLNTIGLRVVENSGELDGIYLTGVQKESISKAEAQGYRIGLG